MRAFGKVASFLLSNPKNQNRGTTREPTNQIENRATNPRTEQPTENGATNQEPSNQPRTEQPTENRTTNLRKEQPTENRATKHYQKRILELSENEIMFHFRITHNVILFLFL
jgi:cell wall-associated NlpC family hydrolase